MCMPTIHLYKTEAINSDLQPSTYSGVIESSNILLSSNILVFRLFKLQ